MKKAFTLIELLVVIAILGLLASIVLVSVKSARDKAKIAGGLQFESSIYHALGAYAVGIWDFDDQTDPTSDSSGNNNLGDLINFSANPWKCEENDTPSGNGCSLQADGSDDYVIASNVRISPSNSWTGLTFSMWINFISLSGSWGHLIETVSANTWVDGITINIASGDFQYGMTTVASGGTGWIPSGYIPAIGEWYHIVMSYDGSNIKFYVNGKLEHARSWTGVVTGQTGLHIIHPSPYAPHANIDNVQVYEQGLSESQIKQLYVEGVQKYNLVSE